MSNKIRHVSAKYDTTVHWDLKDIAPTGYIANRNGLHYTNYTGTSRDPYIDYTLASTVTDNSVFFGCNF